jgi:FdrA protein
MTDHIEIRRGRYYDSVRLMSISRTVGERDGVDSVLVAMATDLNLELAVDMGFDLEAVDDAGPNDLMVALRVRDSDVLARARATVDAVLADDTVPHTRADATSITHRTIGSAARGNDASLALISVPGAHAFVDAMDALASGLNVMIFSDNVPVEHEVVLKAQAQRLGLLVMGPDAGTAIVGGVGLGFANVVRPGPVGVVAASGTGAQQLCCLLDDAGVGVSSVLGVGGRDLSSRVAGAATLQALATLDTDPATEIIVVVSKPAPQDVADTVRAAAAACATPVVPALIAPGAPDLTTVATEVVQRVGTRHRVGSTDRSRRWDPADDRAPSAGGCLRGLFTGGTLCDEAMVIASAALGPIASNIPLRPEWALPDDDSGQGHVMIDFGDDRFTRGRPHPMIDQGLRLTRLAAEARDPTVGVVLLDVVLGHAAHPDPAAELAPAIREARAMARAAGRHVAVVVSLCGTDGDPQDRERQARQLAMAGASVHVSNAAAAREAVRLCGGCDA